MDTKTPAPSELAMQTHALLEAIGEEVNTGNLASLTVIAVSKNGGIMETSLSCDSASLTAMHLAFLTSHQHRFAQIFQQVDQMHKAKVAALRPSKPILNAQGKPLNA